MPPIILSHPVVVISEPQRHAGDCGVVALAMALGVPYEQVFARCPTAGRDGLTARQLQALARTFGVRLRATKRIDCDDDTGILGVEFATHGHWCYLDRGRIIDPPEVWDADVYLANGATADVLLVPEGRVQQRRQQQRGTTAV